MSITLTQDLLCRVLPVQHVKDYLKTNIAEISFSEQLPDHEVDLGDRAAVELATIEDETLPATSGQVVLALRRFVEELFKKMRNAIPWGLLKTLTVLTPSALAALQIKDCK